MSLEELSLMQLNVILTHIWLKGLSKQVQLLIRLPFFFIKKLGKEIRFCVDYRKLKAITKKEQYPIPLIEETLAQLKNAKYFTKIEMRQACYRIRMSKDSEELTTFLTRFDAFKYLVMPFGLGNGSASWQHLINNTLFDFLHRFVQAYLDDIRIYSKTLKDHRSHVRQVLECLREAGIQADVDKCEFHVQEIKFLDLIISTKGTQMDPQKVNIILDWCNVVGTGPVRVTKRGTQPPNFHKSSNTANYCSTPPPVPSCTQLYHIRLMSPHASDLSLGFADPRRPRPRRWIFYRPTRCYNLVVEDLACWTQQMV